LPPPIPEQIEVGSPIAPPPSERQPEESRAKPPIAPGTGLRTQRRKAICRPPCSRAERNAPDRRSRQPRLVTRELWRHSCPGSFVCAILLIWSTGAFKAFVWELPVSAKAGDHGTARSALVEEQRSRPRKGGEGLRGSDDHHDGGDRTLLGPYPVRSCSRSSRINHCSCAHP
jgi:hypothetical protein